ncbi:50S ribosomal protein L25/general stress protein Ctc [Thalassomonas sp. M1454]|nr:50S ribosomal protein L25/general stress protein Ctc [Thalassomonas sp. M1454]TRX56398.1 50S ribosomal protein L25/general stress protein Ctc [Thalassomonas sp. M1454]
MIMDLFTLDAEVRTDLGKGASRRLRHANKVPAIVYGLGEEPVSITLAHNKVWRAQQEEAFYSHVLTLNIGKKKVKVVIKDMQRHVFRDEVMHMDFLRVNSKTELHTSVPLHFINEDVITKAGNVVVHNLNEIEVACLPKDLPEFIEVDVANLEVGHPLHLSDIVLPKGVSSVELGKGEDHNSAVVSATTPKAASSSDEDSAAEGDAEVATEE